MLLWKRLERLKNSMPLTYHQGVPAVPVIVDGGWSKCTYKHSYNAKSGIAVIFGHHTRKLLFFGVGNKFCSVCTVAQNKGKEELPVHKRYHNWDGSFTAMESDILDFGSLSRSTVYATCVSLATATVL